MMQENIKLIDLVIELVDARTPMSSKNPDIDSLAGNKARVILLNKADLADPAGNAAWTEYFKKKDFHVLEINARTGAGVRAVQGLVQEACKEKETEEEVLRTGLSGLWWSVFPMWGNQPLSMLLPERGVPKPVISQV